MGGACSRARACAPQRSSIVDPRKPEAIDIKTPRNANNNGYEALDQAVSSNITVRHLCRPTRCCVVWALIGLACIAAGACLNQEASAIYKKWLLENTFEREDPTETTCTVEQSGWEYYKGDCTSYGQYQSPDKRTFATSKCPGPFGTMAQRRLLKGSRFLQISTTNTTPGSPTTATVPVSTVSPVNATVPVSTTPDNLCWKIPWAKVQVESGPGTQTMQCAFLDGWGGGQDMTKAIWGEGDKLPSAKEEIPCFLYKGAVALTKHTVPDLPMPRPFFEKPLGPPTILKALLAPIGMMLILFSCCLCGMGK